MTEGVRPWLSIVVAAGPGERDADACLTALASQIDDDVELVVVRDGTGEGLVNERWSEGLHLAGGECVGLLASTAVPADDWVAQTRAFHMAGAVAVGGPIEPGPRLGYVDWAVYFTRYSPFLRPLGDTSRLEAPADNASYRTDVLRRYEAVWSHGFWETDVHRAMRDDGLCIVLEDQRVVRYGGGASLRHFSRARLEHGRAFGAGWAAGRARAAVLLAAATAPLIPVVMTARAGRAVFAKRRLRARFVVASPLVLWFYCCWTVGELIGRLRGREVGGR